jgi:hypothetical protein
MTAPLRRLSMLVPLAAAIGLLAACAPDSGAPQSSDAAADPQYCADYLTALNAFLVSPIAGGPEVMQTLDKATIQAEAKKLADEVRALQAHAPAELTTPLKTTLDTMDSVATTGDTGPMNEPEFMTSSTPIDLYAYDKCGWKQVPVTATDYKFEGIPASLPAGTTSFKMDNKSTAEEHVLLITRRKPGVTDSVADIMNMNEGDIFGSKLDLVMAAGAPPGASTATAGELTPGEYIALCPIPQGGKPEGKSHAELGMYQEFTVK